MPNYKYVVTIMSHIKFEKYLSVGNNSIMIVSVSGLVLMLSIIDVHEIVTVLVGNVNDDFDKADTSLVQAYPILVPPSLVIRICLKGTLLLEKLLDNANDCDSYPCMFSKIIEDESMKSISAIIRNDTMDNGSQEFRQTVLDCVIWWKLFKRFDKNANSRRELGKCLFQTVSTKCREPVLDKIKFLISPIKEE
ncbi:uncharacterized protein LOC143363087 [Halictus rubicundus]|uniref:uncharacterized protein LOC143363087 n=1 Tax=Halictus rubicundus TaxID=77578 RepID=UPI0040372077